MIRTTKILLLFYFVALLQSCSYFSKKPDCVNSDPFFDSGISLSEEYQQRVRDILEDTSPDKFRYFFVTFDGKDREYLVVNMRNDQYCFDARLVVSNWDKLAGMRAVNGKSYPEELHNLKWEISDVGGKEEINFIDMNPIVD
jgi:hypothetical protein